MATIEAADKRFLIKKGEIWYYNRAVPLAVAADDDRFPLVRKSLKTADIFEARSKRDKLEAADDALWGAMLVGDDQDNARRRYAAAVRLVEALGYGYKPAEEIGRHETLEAVLGRVEALGSANSPPHVAMALLGGLPAPGATILEVYDLYSTVIAADEIVGKSEQQRRKWRNVKKRGVDLFVKLVGNIDIGKVGREQALTMWRYWQVRVAPTEIGSKRTHTASSANRDLGSMRAMYGAYYAHMGERDRPNPFAGLSFKERNTRRRVRPPFPADWIREKLLKVGPLETMNDEARGILLAEIETGARPSELANLLPEMIVLDHAVPHISIKPREGADDPRELKTEESERIIPLVGVALEVFRAFPSGFPRYREREEAASAAINKFLRENDLTPSGKHTLYGLRHSLEDRMKEAGLGDELRRILMGHKVDRETYGTGGSLEWRRDELKKIALPFDAGVVSSSRKQIVRRGKARRPKPPPAL